MVELRKDFTKFPAFHFTGSLDEYKYLLKESGADFFLAFPAFILKNPNIFQPSQWFIHKHYNPQFLQLLQPQPDLNMGLLNGLKRKL